MIFMYCEQKSQLILFDILLRDMQYWELYIFQFISFVLKRCRNYPDKAEINFLKFLERFRSRLYSKTNPPNFTLQTDRYPNLENSWGSFTLDLCRHLVDLEIVGKDLVLVQARRSNGQRSSSPF